MTTWAAPGYIPRLLEVCGLTDALVYVASDERYNDEAPTQSMNKAAPDTSTTEDNPPNDVMVPTPPAVTPPAPQLPDTRNVANDKVELTRAGLLQVDKLLPAFFEAEHRGTRYT